MPDGTTDTNQLPQGGLGLAGGCALSGVSVIHGESGERDERTPQRLQCRIVGQQEKEKLIQVVRSWNREAEFLKERLQVLFGRLLAVETDEIVQCRLTPSQLACAPGVGLGLANPSRGEPVHTAPCPS